MRRGTAQWKAIEKFKSSFEMCQKFPMCIFFFFAFIKYCKVLNFPRDVSHKTTQYFSKCSAHGGRMPHTDSRRFFRLLNFQAKLRHENNTLTAVRCTSNSSVKQFLSGLKWSAERLHGNSYARQPIMMLMKEI